MKSKQQEYRTEKCLRYSIRKVSFGAASVAVAALFMFLGNGAVSADELGKQDVTVIEKNLEAKASQDGEKTVQPDASATEVTVKPEENVVAQSEPASKPAESAKPTSTLDKSQLESYIAEIEGNISAGKYANKTEESISLLNSEIASAKSVLASATSQEELNLAYRNLVTTVSSKLKNKPVEKTEAPKVDTTNGKETVSKKAENTEKKSNSNSIENTGSNDPRNGKLLDKDNAFRAETTETHGNFKYSMEYSNGKEIYLYNEEDADVNITVSSTAGNITKATVKAGSGQFVLKSKSDQAIAHAKGQNVPMPQEEEVEIDGYGWSYHQTLSETQGPVKIKITGKPNDTFKELKSYTKTEDQRAVLGARYLQLEDSTGARLAGGNNSSAPGYFNLVVKSQTYKYDIKDLTDSTRITVNDIDNVTDAELTTIKSRLQLEHSKTSNDARFVGGTAVANPTSVIDTVAVSTTEPSKLVVTYKDGSTDTIEKNKVLNVRPKGIIPFSNPATKEIYVYKGEETNIELSATDDSGKIKDIRIAEGGRGINAPGAAGGRIRNQYGLTTGYQRNEAGIEATETNPAKVTITGTISVPGQPNYTGNLITRYLVAEDLEGATFSEPNGNSDSGKTVDQLPEGWFRLVVREQTQKYDIQGQTEEGNKIAVSDVNNLSDADFEKIKNNIKIQYNTADDARLSGKNGTLVENASQYIQSITKEGDKIVVTYKDGSTDKITLSNILRTNPAPTVELPYSNPEKKQIYVYTGENTDLTFKATDDSTVKDLYLRGPGGVGNDNTAGYGFTTGKIDNDVVTNGEGTVSNDKRTATIKMTGVTTLTAPNQWTSFVVANDNDNASSFPEGQNYDASNDDAVRQQKPGYVQFVVKDQTSKYDIVAPTEKVAVADPANVTEADLEKIKEKLKLEYSSTNDDANLADKKGKNVDDKDTKIKSVTKDAQGNLVVTYKDGSVDKKPLSEFVNLNKQPALYAVNKAAEDKIAEINKTPNATDEEKAAAIAKVNADKEKALTAINDANAKDALDKAKESGTTAIAADNPVVAKKDAAKADVEAARKAKEKAIDARTDLSDKEKAAAKLAAKNIADAAKKAIDNATTDADVETAQTTGTDNIATVNPIAKEAAQQAVADELAKKEEAIDARDDLTQEEKDAAKKEAQAKAKEATDAINAQPDTVDTPEEATAAQQAVDAARDKGVADVKAVNPKAAKKAEAKKTIDDALTAKNNAIDARTDLTPEQKTALKNAAKAKADAAKDAIDKATTNDAVDKAKDAGTTAVANVTPVVKEPAKQAIAKALEDKNAEIDKRTDLTDEEKAAAKKEAKDKADAQLAEIAKQPDVADTPEAAKAAQDAVDAAKKTGVDEVTAVNPTAVTKPDAKKAIDEKLAKQLEDIANTPDATDEEKAEAVKKAEEAAKNAKDAVDAATTDATVGTEKEVAVGKDGAKGTIDQALPVVKDKPNARKAIEDEAKAKKAEIDARNDLSPKAKEALKAKVDKVANKAKAAIDAVSSEADVNVIEEADKEAIKAIGDINRPIDKVLVKDPSALTDEEKAKILEEVKKVNPTAKEVKYDDNGKIEVTTEAGDKGIINPTKLVKTEDQLDNGKGGNDINKPLDKVIVKDPSKLTDEEKAKIVAEVEEVNPDAIVTIDENGTVSVSTPDGKTAAIPATDLVRTKEDTEKAGAGNSNIVKPADKVVGEANDSDDQAKVEEKLRELNPETKSVTFDENGNATVTLKDGTTATIPSEDLFKSETDVTKPNAGNDIVKPADKTLVKDPNALTDAEKEAIVAKVKEVNPDATVVVDEKGNATVTTKDGKTAVIPGKDLVKTATDATKPNAGNDIVKPADKTVVANPDKLTDAEKKAIEDKVKAVNPGATVVVDDKGNATVTTPEGKTAVIPAADLTKSAADVAKPNAGNDIVKPADKTVVANPEKLTDAEKKAIEDKVKAVNPGATVVVDDKGNATVTTPEGKTAVIPAADLTKSAADATKPNAGNDIVKPADKTVVANPDALTPEEKKAIEDKVKAVNPGATVVVDDKGNATVTTPEGKTAVIPAADLTKDPAAATKPNAGNDIVKPADKTVVANPEKLTDAEKKAIEDKVKSVNPGATVVVDDKGNATVTTPEGKTAVIPAADLTKSAADAAKPNAGNDIVKPADKTVVANPEKLTDAEKKAIEDKVKAVNPGATVAVDDKGNATVTTPEGKTAVIPASDLTKSAADAAKPNAGNDIVKPADKTVVANPGKLTDAEKKAIEDKVKAVNPGATVAVDDKGNATVTTPEGKTAVIPATDLVKSPEDATKPNAGNDIVKPADKTVVVNPGKLTDAEKKAIEDKVKAVNPGATVAVDDKGNATVTTPEGKTAVIPATDLVKSPEDATKPNAGNDIVKPADKTAVANPDALTDAEKKAIEDKVKAVNPDATVVVDDKGNATVTTPEGKTAVIPAADLTKDPAAATKPNAGNDIVKPADKTVVANPEKLTDAEKKAIEDKVKAVNPDATVVVDDKGNATVTTPEGKTAVIPAADLTKDPAAATKPNAGNDIVKPADKTVVANPEKLTDAEKKAIEDKVKAVNPGSTVAVDDKGNATVTTPEGKTAVILATDLTKNADAEKAPKAGNDIVKPASKTKVANPDSLTKDEKDAIATKVKAVNPGVTVVVDDKGNATVTLPNGNTAVIPASDLTKSEKDVNDGKAKDNAVTPAAKTKVANPEKLTDAEKKAIEDKVKAANPGAEVVVDDKGNATVVQDGNVSVIPSTDLVKVEDDANKPNGGNDANTPAAKTVVKDPANLTDEEKAKVKKAVEAVNPGSTVVVDDKGNATVTKGDGTVLNIPASDLVIPAEKLADEATNAKVKTPAVRTLVGDKENLTDAEKEAVKKTIEAVNPGATVVVDDKGNATVTMPDGSTATISKEQLVKDKEAVSKSKHGGDNLDIDLSKVMVTDLTNITPEEKAKFQFMILGAITDVDEFDLDAFLKEIDAQGNTIYKSKDSNVIITIDKDGNMKVMKDGKTNLAVNIDKAGNVTIVTKEGQVLAIPRDDAFKQRPSAQNNGGNGTSGNNGATNNESKVDKAKLEGAIRQLDELIIKESAKFDAETAKEANKLSADAKKVFANADATQAEVDAMVKRIEDFMAKVASSTDHATPANDQAAQTPAAAPATAQAVSNASQEAAENARKAAKELPNTGTADSVAFMVAAAASAVLGLGLAGRRRKEDEEA